MLVLFYSQLKLNFGAHYWAIYNVEIGVCYLVSTKLCTNSFISAKNHYFTFKSNVMKIHPTCWHWLIYFFILLENWILKLIQLLYSLYVLNRLLLLLCLQVYVSTLNSRLWIYFANSGMVIWETDFIILKYATRATFLSKCMANCWDAQWGRKIQFFSESLKVYDFFLKK